MALDTSINETSVLTVSNMSQGVTSFNTTTTNTTTTMMMMMMTSSTPFILTATPSPSPPTPKEWTGGLVAEYIVRNVLSVLMVLINGLVLLTLRSTYSLRTPTNWVIGSLAVTDLLVGLLGPAGLLIELEVVVSPIMCRVGYAGVMAFTSVSINHLLFVSVDRYILVSKPLRYQSLITKRRVWIFIGTSWTWAGAISSSFLTGLSLKPDWNGRCRAELMYPLWFIIFLTFCHFVIPFVLMLYVYINIFIVARRQQKAVKNSFRGSTVESQSLDTGGEGGGGGGGERGGGGGGGEGEESGSRKLSVSSCRAKLRAAKLLVVPCGYFYFSWGPWFGVVLWAISTGRMVEPHGLERFVQTLAILNSLGNPVLYAVSQPVLGKAMLVKLKSVCKACKKGCAKKASYIGKPLESTTLVRPLPRTTPEATTV